MLEYNWQKSKINYRTMKIVKKKGSKMNNTEIINQLRKSRTQEYPPRYRYDKSQLRNCYAHALDIGMEDPMERNIFIPGMIATLAKEKDVVIIERPFIYNYKKEQIINSIKADCKTLGILAEETELNSPYKKPKSYKIILCEDDLNGAWHFARETLSEVGEKIWTHKVSWRYPTSKVKIKGNLVSVPYSCKEYEIRAVLELSPLEDN